METYYFKFATVNYINGNGIDPKEYFSSYHFYEKYDQNKDYDKIVFQHDYGFGIRKYIYELYDGGMIFGQYVIAQEILNEYEKDCLVKYCQCEYHRMYWFNINKYYIYPSCIGCVGELNPSQENIDKTKKYMEECKTSNVNYILSYFI
jgi:hypothetical protein